MLDKLIENMEDLMMSTRKETEMDGIEVSECKEEKVTKVELIEYHDPLGGKSNDVQFIDDGD